MRLDRALVVSGLLVVSSATACRDPEIPRPPADVLWDPQLLAVDRAAPFTAFDGASGSVLLGGDWASYEQYSNRLDRLLDRSHDFAWVLDGEAWIHVERPDAEALDFFAVVMPFAYPEERQELVLTVDGHELGRRELDDGWHEVRIPLRDFGAGWKRIGLSFRYAVRPSEVSGAPDERRLSAAFRRIALVPRQVEDALAFLTATHLDESGRLRLAEGAAVSLPLPAASEVTLHLGRLADGGGGGERDCRLRFELEATGAERGPLFAGTVADAARRGDLAFSTPAGVPCRLRLSADGCGGSYDPRAAAELPLTKDLLSIRRGAIDRRDRPHVFIYTIDTLRADSLSVYGSGRPASPRIAEFARDAVTYEDVWSSSAWTLPSVVSVMTGVYPDRHQVSLGLPKLTESSPATLAERLAGHGYAPVAVSQSFIVGPKFGLDSGFGDAFYLSDQLGGSQLCSQEARSYLLQWLLHRWDGDRPIFAYLHTVDPHAPYLPPPPDRRFAEEIPTTLSEDQYTSDVFLIEKYAAGSPEVEQLRARYDGEVAYADREFGRFIDMLRYLALYDGSLIVLMSDHGEEFGEHGGFDHGRAMYEEMLQVPLIVKYPGSAAAGTRVESAVSAVDVAPTVLRWASAPSEGEGLDGRVLPPFDGGEGGPGRRFAFSEVKADPGGLVAGVHFRALRMGGVKCIESVSGNDQFDRPIPRWQGFDLAHDPREARLLAEDDPRLGRCRDAMERWTASRRGSALAGAAATDEWDEATVERLRALGYVE